MNNNIKNILQKKGINQIDLARAIWPDSSTASQHALIRNLMNGESGINPEQWITVVCKFLDVTPNELFGYTEKKLTPEQKAFHADLMKDKKVVRVDWVLDTCNSLKISPNDLFNFKK
jgi:DNA-binding Xre family transcriptional regulator